MFTQSDAGYQSNLAGTLLPVPTLLLPPGTETMQEVGTCFAEAFWLHGQFNS